MKVFWDTNVFIYLIEQHPRFHEPVRALYQHHLDQREAIATSALTLGELLTQPLRAKRADLAERYLHLLSAGEIELVDFDRRAARCYAEIRASFKVRPPDAVQLACAKVCGAGIFFTNDEALWAVALPEGPAVRGLSE